ncbi:hypothetical protein GCM10009117_21680 [Gangjinia marincola]|uniref:PhoD-like phosphatase metallophosphatase domain-containing protein n=1 Tax=Gangjinia marincola TaxID=578463 RepID=A0ABN1MII2_9FLAO
MKTALLSILGMFMLTLNAQQTIQTKDSILTLALGSCNKQDREQPFWDEIIELQPDVFIWGGDNIYGDTKDMELLKAKYDRQSSNPGYQRLKNEVPVLGTWDDHDYGKNDAGREFKMKKESQQLFLDFYDVPKNDPRRDREGVYHAETILTPYGTVQIIMLDTRYFRSPLRKNKKKGKGKKRYLVMRTEKGLY